MYTDRERRPYIFGKVIYESSDEIEQNMIEGMNDKIKDISDKVQ